MAGFARTAHLRFIFFNILFGASSAFAEINHATTLIRPNFFASPQSISAINSLHSENNTGSHAIKTAVSVFYSKNFSPKFIGAGLGPSDSNIFSVTTESLKGDVNSDYMISVLTAHDSYSLQAVNETIHRPQATITFTPDQQETGINLLFHHDLDLPINDCFYRIEVSFVHQKRSLNAVYSQEKVTKTDLSDIISIKDFFNGAEQSLSYGLSHLKIPQQMQKRSHFDRVQITAGHHLLNTNAYRVTLFGCAQIPCGPDDSYEFIFAPEIGTKHLHVGLGCTTNLTISKTISSQWDISNTSIAGYNFPKNEPRIPTIANLSWWHYYQSLQNGVPADSWLSPAVNSLPKSLNINQGLSLQNITLVSYQKHSTVINCGISAGYKEEEKNTPTIPWTDNTFGITNKFINPINFTGASNNPSAPAFYIEGRMYPRTAGALPETTGETSIVSGTTTLTPLTTGARGQNMCKKKINNKDLNLNHPTLFYYQLFASFGQKITLSDDSNLFINSGLQISFGSPKELVMRNYQLWLNIGCNF
ncbi:hypothetical protein FJ366_02275 [Candidatus Dependentiae bacterium]|nr:hypothetical protein [Candidatus Dependentiae bacterium]